MGKLAGLLGSGIGFAMEASGSYQSSKSSDKNSYGSRNTSSSISPGSHFRNSDRCITREIENDAQVFEDVQSYADYQTQLVERLDNDLALGYLCSTHPTPTECDGRLPGEGRLSYPVIIPQRRPETRDHGWKRAYAPVLMDCGIDQDTFLTFLDSFNEATKTSPYFDAINVAAAGAGFARGLAPMVIAMAVPAAVRFAKSAQTNQQSDTFLKRANRDLFAPHGLFAMVMKFKPEEQQNNYLSDPSQRDFSTPRVQLPPSAPLVFLDPQDYPSHTTGNQLSKMNHFNSDYGDGGAQTRYASNNSDSASAAEPVSNLRSRWGDPNHEANFGGRGKNRSDKDRRKEEKRSGKRDRRDSLSLGRLQKRGGLLGSVVESAISQVRDVQKPGLVGGVRSMKSGPGKDNQGLIKGLKGLGMQTDVLYLIIVNNDETNSPNASSSPGYQRQDPLLYRPEQSRQQSHNPSTSGTYAEQYKYEQKTKETNDTDPSHTYGDYSIYDREEVLQPRAPDDYFGSVNHPQAVETFEAPRSPPPQYTQIPPARYQDYRRNREFCVPTL